MHKYVADAVTFQAVKTLIKKKLNSDLMFSHKC